MKSVRERLRDMREDHDYTQEQIAKILGITQQHYSTYENGVHEFPLRHFIKLAEYYNVSADYLIGRCEYDEKKPVDWAYVTRGCSGEELLRAILSLSERGRKAVIEYVELQQLKEAQKPPR